MTLKDLSKVVGASTHIRICQRIECAFVRDNNLYICIY